MYSFNQGLELLHKHGLTVSQKALTLKAKELAACSDDEVNSWKDQCVTAKEEEECLSKLQKCLETLVYLPEMPTVKDAENYLNEHVVYEDEFDDNMGQVTSQFIDDMQTLDVSELNLCCLQPKPSSLLQSVCSNLDASKGVIRHCLEGILMSANDHNTSLLDAVVLQRKCIAHTLLPDSRRQCRP